MGNKKEIAKNFAAGFARTGAEMGLTAAKGFGKLSSAIGSKIGNQKAGNYIQRAATKGLASVNNKLGARADTKAGRVGGFVAASIPAARVAGTVIKVKRAMQVAKHSKAGKLAYETYKKNLVSKARRKK